MPRRADIMIAHAGGAASFNDGAGTQYMIQTPGGVFYWVYSDPSADVVFRKSIDGGFTWLEPIVVFAGTVISLSVWYDRWSDISAGLIHIAYTENVGHDCLYRTIDTESSDALSTQTTIFAGVSAVLAGSFLSICRARGGNVYCRVQIDASAEGGFFRLPNANVPNGAWDAARTINEAGANGDQCILLPGWAADNQDMMMIFWDISANEISRQLYDDSANSWAETSISTGMAELASTTAYPNFAAVVDIANSRNIFIAWNANSAVNADLLGWTVTESAITAFTTPVVLNSGGNQGLCAFSINTISGNWYAFYSGKSDGSEAWSTAANIYYKVSTDQGVTWGDETLLTIEATSVLNIYTVPRSLTSVAFTTLSVTSLFSIKVSIIATTPRANLQIGI